MRLIDADELKENTEIIFDERTEDLEEVVTSKQIDEAPTVDPFIHARWIKGSCSNCGAGLPTDTINDFLSESDSRYCWYCGARMDEEQSNEQ